MLQIERIRQLAEEVLTFQERTGHTDRWLWDRACRIARYAECICKLPEILEKGESIDQISLLTAAYFSDAGFKLYTKLKDISMTAAMLELRGRQLRDFSVQILQEQADGSPFLGNIDRVCRILVESENRTTRLTEARILSDARGLDDIGNMGILQDVRRCLLQGKGPGALLEGWDRKIEYRYWDARLKEGFHFSTVQQVAKRRFAAMEQCVQQLRMETDGTDLQNITLESFNSVS